MVRLVIRVGHCTRLRRSLADIIVTPTGLTPGSSVVRIRKYITDTGICGRRAGIRLWGVSCMFGVSPYAVKTSNLRISYTKPQAHCTKIVRVVHISRSQCYTGLYIPCHSFLREAILAVLNSMQLEGFTKFTRSYGSQ